MSNNIDTMDIEYVDIDEWLDVMKSNMEIEQIKKKLTPKNPGKSSFVNTNFIMPKQIREKNIVKDDEYYRNLRSLDL